MTTFAHAVDDHGVQLRLEQPQGFLGRTKMPLPTAEWLSRAPDASRMALSRLWDWSLDGRVDVQADAVRVPHDACAQLTDSQAKALGLPDACPFAAHLEHDGTFDQPAFRLSLTWRRNFQPVPVRRVGSILNVGQQSYRLGEALYRLAEAVDAFNHAPATNIEERFLIWASIQPYVEQVDDLRTSDYLTQTRIAHASRFSIHIEQGKDGPTVVPVLFGPERESLQDVEAMLNQPEDREPLLPKRYQDIFAQKRFPSAAEARGRYALGEGWYAVLDDTLKSALTEVRRVQSLPADARRQFARNPQAWLQEHLTDKIDESSLDSLFVVTDQYSQRVVEMGIWEKPVVPWIKLQGNQWLPSDGSDARATASSGETSPSPARRAKNLAEALKEAQLQGQTTIQFEGREYPVTPQAVEAAEREWKDLEASADATGTASSVPKNEELLPASNLHEPAYEEAKRPRAIRVQPMVPDALQSILKPHQDEGLRWLQDSYIAGFPGVLLADDMGLGKTLQVLSFLVWLSKAQTVTRPLLVVAPTGLLKNWENEASLHFKANALGAPYLAYGRNPVTAERMRSATWILTTYETVRNREQAFAGISFGAVVFDEMQKLKSPDSHVTKCALTLNAGFVVGMTGTPVENRLADLWCLMDRVWPGLLPELRLFSEQYEANPKPETNLELKNKMLNGRGSDPAIMLRRMKDQHLPGLPNRQVMSSRVQMPNVQARAYDKILSEAKDRTDPGWMLQALQRLRAVCLHPILPEESDQIPDEQYISQSARLSATFKVLDEVYSQKRKALVFVELISMQYKLASLLQRRYRLKDLPMIISGEINGPERQKRVNRFQADESSFDVMILSPRAGGVGITLTAANHVIHLSRWWNPAVEDQCSDRIFRIGQKRDIVVHAPLAVHPRLGDDSFDTKLDKLLDRKRTMSRELLAPTMPTEDDLKQLWAE